MPSPEFVSSTLEATRPELRAGSTRVVPVLDGVTYSKPSSRPVVVIQQAPPPPPVVVITESAPPPQPETVEVPVAYPVPVYLGVLNPSKPPARNPGGQKPAVPPPSSKPDKPGQRTVTTAAAQTREKKFKKPNELEVAREAIQDVNQRRFAKAIIELDTWKEKYAESDYKADRLYYYVLAYNGVEQPGKSVDAATALLSDGLENTLQDPRQIILALYLTALNIQKVPYPSRDQFVTGQTAARNLLDFVPSYFTDANRPPETSASDWHKAQADLETTARTTLTALSRRQRH